MAVSEELLGRVREHYNLKGKSKKGGFVGYPRFNEIMSALLPEESKSSIKKAINRVVREEQSSKLIAPETIPIQDIATNPDLSTPTKSLAPAENGTKILPTSCLKTDMSETYTLEEEPDIVLLPRTKSTAQESTKAKKKVKTQVKQELEEHLLQPKLEKANRTIREPESRFASENIVGNGIKDHWDDEEEDAVLERSPNSKIMELKQSLQASYNGSGRVNGYSGDGVGFTGFVLADQMRLLSIDVSTPSDRPRYDSGEIKNAVLFSANVLEKFGKYLLPQYGLLGSATVDGEVVPDPVASRLFLNCNIPFSAFICGVQGSGKSHTTSCLIENCLISSPILGVLQKPLSAMVFQWSENSSRLNFTPSEAAFLASSSAQLPNHPAVKSVTVLASPSNIVNLRAMYEEIPNVTVKPFLLRPRDLDISTMLTLMSVDNSQAAPLYMSQIIKILRDMACKFDGPFNYNFFRRSVDATDFDSKQREFLNQRLSLLESFLDLKNTTKSPTFSPGTITILDLSCPFVDANTACVLFKIGLNMYLDSSPTVGKVLAVDEAHKYMTDTPASKALTESLLTVIRQQRHFGIRVILSTQEPTISPRLIDLCSMVVIHRFSSPDWFHTLRRHIPILVNQETNNTEALELFRSILSLKTGQALCFAPSAMMQVAPGDGTWNDATMAGDEGEIVVRKLSEGMLKMNVRKRVTWDGGRSIVCL